MQLHDKKAQSNCPRKLGSKTQATEAGIKAAPKPWHSTVVAEASSPGTESPVLRCQVSNSVMSALGLITAPAMGGVA
jgi:hypothetical protein